MDARLERLSYLLHVPDKVIGKGLSASFIEQAKMQMQKINNAYEAICKSRGIHS